MKPLLTGSGAGLESHRAVRCVLALFGHNQAPLPVLCGSNPAPPPSISGPNLAPLPALFGKNQAPLPFISGLNQATLAVISAKEAQFFRLFQLNIKLKKCSVGLDFHV